MSTTTVLERMCSERDEARNAAIAMAEADGFSPQDPTYKALEKPRPAASTVAWVPCTA